jgi:subtilisin family serine protease
MSEPAPRNAILASHSITQPGELDRLNAILEGVGLGRPLGPPVHITPAVVELPVARDPRQVVAAVRAAPEGGHHQVSVPAGYSVDTVNHDPTAKPTPLVPTDLLHATGLKSGHGTVTWVPAPPEAMPDKPPWPPKGPSPVVVVLDSGVKPHSWLPLEATDTDPRRDFWFVPDPAPSFVLPGPDPTKIIGDYDFGSYWGHATFLAGLIRLTAPEARVMSLKLMSDAGTLDDGAVLQALSWLHDEYINRGHRVDVVLMAFGRPKEPGEANPELLRDAITELGRKRVKFVASAGNDHSHTETIPACLAAEPHSPVISVGAGTSAANHEPYSNHGPWVREWRPGTVVSLMPLTKPGPGASEDGNGFALWSGTSFSAAIVAGELAQARAAKASSHATA